MKQQNQTLDKAKYHKIKTGFVTLLQEARKVNPEVVCQAILDVFETLRQIDFFFDESAVTGYFLRKFSGSISPKQSTIRKLTGSFAAYAALNGEEREVVLNQLRMSLEVESLKISIVQPKEAA